MSDALQSALPALRKQAEQLIALGVHELANLTDGHEAATALEGAGLLEQPLDPLANSSNSDAPGWA